MTDRENEKERDTVGERVSMETLLCASRRHRLMQHIKTTPGALRNEAEYCTPFVYSDASLGGEDV